MTLRTPITVSLDTSQWDGLIRDANSADQLIRWKAREFPKTLLSHGGCLLFSLHHLLELMAHSDQAVVERRLNYIRDIEYMSWIGLKDDEVRLGGIPQIFRIEAQIAACTSEDAFSVRREVRPHVVQWGNGSAVLVDDPLSQKYMGTFAKGRLSKNQKNSALVPIKFIEEKMTISELKSGEIASGPALLSRMESMSTKTVEEIENYGDAKIRIRSERVAAEFMRDVYNSLGCLPHTASDIVEYLYLKQGLDKDEIGDNCTVRELGELGLFRTQLRVSLGDSSPTFESIKREVDPKQIPHWVTRAAMRRFYEAQAERKGSDVTDASIASLAPYVDLLYVDKRTAENFRQILAKRPQMNQLIGQVKNL